MQLDRTYWNEFRANYPYKFEEMVELYKSWHEAAPSGFECSNEDLSHSMLKEFLIKTNKTLSVFEFGCGTGLLAKDVLDNCGNFVSQWTGYDLINITESINKFKFLENKYNNFIWNTDFEFDYDLFVSTHTLEHINENQLRLLFDKIKNSNIKYLFLTTPFDPAKPAGGWHNSGSAHILELDFNSYCNAVSSCGFNLTGHSQHDMAHTAIFERTS